MIKPICNFILLQMSLVVFAQNYQTIYSNRTPLFELPDNSVVSFRVDSIVVDTDSVFYFPKHIEMDTINYMCFRVASNFWIGGSMRITDEFNIFTNKHNDSIRLKTNAILGEQWIICEKPDSFIVTGEVTAHNNMNFLGITDSVKTISFQMFDYLMNPISSPLNNMTIQISKHHGLIKTLNFNLFPHYSSDFYVFDPFYSFGLVELPIIGITNPDLGKQNLTYLRAFDFDIGDELHVKMYSYNSNGGMSSKQFRRQIIIFTNRTTFPDSIQYSSFVKEEHIIILNPGSDTTITYNEFTQYFTVKPDSAFDLLPSELIVSDYSIEDQVTYNLVQLRKYTNLNEFLMLFSGDLYCHGHYDGCDNSDAYIEGLGGPYYNCSMLFYAYTRELVYYKKGIETWGNPHSFTNVTNFAPNGQLKITPNPASDFLIISSENSIFPLTFHLFDLFGRIVFTSSVEFSGQQIPVSHLPGGLYIYQFLYNDEISGKGKIVIE
jgi:hypothetical protein